MKKYRITIALGYEEDIILYADTVEETGKLTRPYMEQGIGYSIEQVEPKITCDKCMVRGDDECQCSDNDTTACFKCERQVPHGKVWFNGCIYCDKEIK